MKAEAPKSPDSYYELYYMDVRNEQAILIESWLEKKGIMYTTGEPHFVYKDNGKRYYFMADLWQYGKLQDYIYTDKLPLKPYAKLMDALRDPHYFWTGSLETFKHPDNPFYRN
jgi:hypothetical protein